MIYLNKDFEKYWAGNDPFEVVDAIEGDIFRRVKSRRTLRFEMDGKGYFAKIQRGVGWGEILKNLMMFKKPVLSARSEYESIRRLEELGIATMKVTAFGERGKNPAKQLSFIITEDLINTESLEDICSDWPVKPPPIKFKIALINQVASIAKKMHDNGMNHRDFYICHFLLDIAGGAAEYENCKPKLFLIDLHRAQIRPKLPLRWRVKDIGGLYFSVMNIGVTRNDIYRFIRIYTGKSLRETFTQDKRFWKSVQKRAIKTYRRDFGNSPVLITGIN